MYVYDFESLAGQKIMTLADTAASPIAANTQGVLVAGPAAILESGQFFCEVKLISLVSLSLMNFISMCMANK